MFEVGGTWYQNRVWTYIPLDMKKVYLITARALSGQAFWFSLWIISQQNDVIRFSYTTINSDSVPYNPAGNSSLGLMIL